MWDELGSEFRWKALGAHEQCQGAAGAGQEQHTAGMCKDPPQQGQASLPYLPTKDTEASSSSQAPGELLLPYPAPENCVVFEYKCKISCSLV